MTESCPLEMSEHVPAACLLRDSSNSSHRSLYTGLGFFSLSSLFTLIEKDSRIISRHLCASSTTMAPRWIGLFDPATPNTDFPLNSFLQFVTRIAAELRNGVGGLPLPERSWPGAVGN